MQLPVEYFIRVFGHEKRGYTTLCQNQPRYFHTTFSAIFLAGGFISNDIFSIQIPNVSFRSRNNLLTFEFYQTPFSQKYLDKKYYHFKVSTKSKNYFLNISISKATDFEPSSPYRTRNPVSRRFSTKRHFSRIQTKTLACKKEWIFNKKNKSGLRV